MKHEIFCTVAYISVFGTLMPAKSKKGSHELGTQKKRKLEELCHVSENETYLPGQVDACSIKTRRRFA